jgi:hypothetical protein
VVGFVFPLENYVFTKFFIYLPSMNKVKNITNIEDKVFSELLLLWSSGLERL